MGEKISISAALKRAARVKGQLKEQDERAKAAACFIEGKEPAFEFKAAMELRRQLVDQLLRIESAVATSNAQAGKLPSGTPVIVAIRKLAELRSEIAFYRALPVRAKEKDVEVEEDVDYDLALQRNVRREKKKVYVSAVTLARVADVVGELEAAHDALCSELDSHNHRTLVEV